jgi:hypothetical protein
VGGLGAAESVPAPAWLRSTALLLADLDVDGFLDLLAGQAARDRGAVFWGTAEGFVDLAAPLEISIYSPERFQVLQRFHRTFLRGDADVDGKLDLADARTILEELFLGREMACGDASDADDSGTVNVTDALYLARHVALGDEAPPYPYPVAGGDTTRDRSDQHPRSILSDLGCSSRTFRYRDNSPCFEDALEATEYCRNPPRQLIDPSLP